MIVHTVSILYSWVLFLDDRENVVAFTQHAVDLLEATTTTKKSGQMLGTAG